MVTIRSIFCYLLSTFHFKLSAFYFLFFAFCFSSCLRNRHDEPEPETKFDFSSSIVHNGQKRTFLVHLPSGYYLQSHTLPLILGFHGGLGSADNFRDQSGLNVKADQENFIVVYPDGLDNPGPVTQTWNAGKCCGQNALTLNTDDVGFVSALIDEMVKTYHVDEKRIYATGHSNGAMLCYRLANELSDKIAAIAPNAGNFQIRTAYAPSRNVPVLDIQSKLDENVIYEGGISKGPAHQLNPPLDSCLNIVASRASCQQTKVLKETHTLYSVYRWETCDPESFEVLLYLTEDGGHSWPGGNKGHIDADEPSQAFKNNDVIWEFFKRHSLP
jgi:polyhydroxybutyrate depolymerase